MYTAHMYMYISIYMYTYMGYYHNVTYICLDVDCWFVVVVVIVICVVFLFFDIS